MTHPEPQGLKDIRDRKKREMDKYQCSLVYGFIVSNKHLCFHFTSDVFLETMPNYTFAKISLSYKYAMASATEQIVCLHT